MNKTKINYINNNQKHGIYGSTFCTSCSSLTRNMVLMIPQFQLTICRKVICTKIHNLGSFVFTVVRKQVKHNFYCHIKIFFFFILCLSLFLSKGNTGRIRQNIYIIRWFLISAVFFLVQSKIIIMKKSF